MKTHTIKHGDILDINCRDGGWFRVYTIEGFYKESQARMADNQTRYPEASFSQPRWWDVSLDAYKAHNKSVDGQDGQDFGLSEEAVMIASDGMTMNKRYAMEGTAVIEADFGDTVILDGNTYLIGKDFGGRPKLKA